MSADGEHRQCPANRGLDPLLVRRHEAVPGLRRRTAVSDAGPTQHTATVDNAPGRSSEWRNCTPTAAVAGHASVVAASGGSSCAGGGVEDHLQAVLNLGVIDLEEKRALLRVRIHLLGDLIQQNVSTNTAAAAAPYHQPESVAACRVRCAGRMQRIATSGQRIAITAPKEMMQPCLP